MSSLRFGVHVYAAMDSTGSVPESHVSTATSVSETDEATKLQEQMEQLKQLMTELKRSNAFEDTVTYFIHTEPQKNVTFYF